MRVLVTGSRQVLDQAPIYAALDRAYDEWLSRWPESVAFPGMLLVEEEGFIVTHGAAPGADTFANQWCHDRRNNPIPPVNDPHPANWAAHGRQMAGFIRNVEMIRLFPHLVLAFFQTGAENSGTRQCVTESHRWLDTRGTPIVEEWLP